VSNKWKVLLVTQAIEMSDDELKPNCSKVRPNSHEKYCSGPKLVTDHRREKVCPEKKDGEVGKDLCQWSLREKAAVR
jgi:hypothetical protein